MAELNIFTKNVIRILIFILTYINIHVCNKLLKNVFFHIGKSNLKLLIVFIKKIISVISDDTSIS